MSTKVVQNHLVYLLDEENNTARIIGNKLIRGNVFIPRSINYKSTEYIITTISEDAFLSTKIESIAFHNNSAIQTIENCAFNGSNIEYLIIPPSLTDLQEGWCFGVSNLANIVILPGNPNYKMYNDTFILSRANNDSKSFDTIIFCLRDAQEVTIPNFIKVIDSYAFNFCEQLLEINFEEGSKLEIIKSNAFSYSGIDRFTIPPHLTYIGEEAFSCCDGLCELEIPYDSDLQIIGKEAFSNSAIENFTIPSNLIELGKGWCIETPYLNEIDVSPDNRMFCVYNDQMILRKSSINEENFDVLEFCVRNAEKVEIPNFVKTIGAYAFNRCVTIVDTDINEDSQLQKIGDSAFSDSVIESFYFPSNLCDLSEKWCCNTQTLCDMKISPNNKYFKSDDSDLILGKSSIESEIFDVIVFAHRYIEKIEISSEIKKIGPYAFQRCEELKELVIPENSQLEIIGKYAFSSTSIEILNLPLHITEICDKAFFYSKQLWKVQIPINSDLKSIGKSAFANSSIQCFTITPHLTRICDSAFNFCKKLKKIKIHENSELQIIGDDAFGSSSIQSFIVPPHVKKIYENAFSSCECLKIIEFCENSELEPIDQNVFEESQQVLIMCPQSLNLKIK